jgi:hypothetical protein
VRVFDVASWVDAQVLELVVVLADDEPHVVGALGMRSGIDESGLDADRGSEPRTEDEREAQQGHGPEHDDSASHPHDDDDEDRGREEDSCNEPSAAPTCLRQVG